jgi:hypothetical protein
MTSKKSTGNEIIRDPNTPDMFEVIEEPETKTEELPKRGRGRPRQYAKDTERVQAFRDRKRKAGRRMEVFITDDMSWRVRELATAWGCSSGEVFARLVMEADQHHRDILFPAEG